MDRNYYYRILGVRSDATPAQIKAAYETRIARLNSADYDDEPGYARRKKEQATKAYRVLLGAAPPVSKVQKKAYFEKFKDAIENREGMDRDDFDRDTSKPKLKLPNISLPKRRQGRTVNKSKIVLITIILIIATTIMGIASAIIGIVRNFDSGYDYDDYLYMEEFEDAEELFLGLSYYDMLDTSTIAANQSKIVWNDGIDKYGAGELFNSTLDILYRLNIYDAEEFYTYTTGDEDFYLDHDDYDCATTLIIWLRAPSFDDVAGATNLYNNKPILSLTDYMEYLEEYIYEYCY